MTNFLSRMWDPRPILAREWLEAAEKYEDLLRGNPSLNPQIVEAIFHERNRIRALFNGLMPEFAGRISVVITTDARVENVSIFSWNDHLYVLVSGALIGRPNDHPEDTGEKAWEWLARHEIAHIRGGHLPWFFHTRRLFRFGCLLACFQNVVLNRMLGWGEFPLWLLGSLWFVQTIVGLSLEWQADLAAAKFIDDPSVLKEAEKSLDRMTLQARKRWNNPILSGVYYAINLVFLDPHPPFAARRWLLRRRLRALEGVKQI